MSAGSLRGRLRQREQHYRQAVSATPILERLSCEDGGGGVIRDDLSPSGSPPFCCAFSQVLNNGSYLAAADEDGLLVIVDTERELPSSFHRDSSRPKPVASWEAHHNAIFDVAWTQSDARMLTAAGDHTVGLWDTSTAQQVGSCRGHTGSVKAVTPHPANPYLFASGSRDGNVHVWDMRCAKGVAAGMAGPTVALRPVLSLKDAHVPNRRRSGCRSLSDVIKQPKKGTSSRGITCVEFLKLDAALVSSSAQDGVVKYWDLRRFMASTQSLAVDLFDSDDAPDTAKQVAELSTPQWMEARKHGITWMSQDSHGTRLLVSASNSVHYLYNVAAPHAGPQACLTGHTTDSFYIKTAFSPTGDHVLSGSSDGHACIWPVFGGRDSNPILLGDFEKEVSGVAWHPKDLANLATCCDDSSLQIWRPSHEPCRARRPVTKPSARPALQPVARQPHSTPESTAAVDLAVQQAAPLPGHVPQSVARQESIRRYCRSSLQGVSPLQSTPEPAAPLQDPPIPEAGATADARPATEEGPSTSGSQDAATAADQTAQQPTQPLSQVTPPSAAMQRRLTDFFSLSSARAKRLKAGEGSSQSSCMAGASMQQENCPPEPGVPQKPAEAGAGSSRRSVLSVLNAAA